MFWSVVQTESRREHVAAKFLEQDEFEIYLPKIINPQLASRQRTVPLFPGYVFVKINEQWWSVRWAVGVIRMLMVDNKPARVDDEILDAMRAREINGLVRLEPKQRPRGIGYGDRVRVLRGSMEGKIGIYQGQSGPQRSRILLNLLGREVKAVVRLTDLAKA